jgi:hypothetical protein
MATQVEQGAELDRARTILAERGIVPDATDAYSEGAILAAIRARGWEAKVEGEPGDWTVVITEDSVPGDFVSVSGSDEDRLTALVRVAAAAFTWLDRDEARRAFDREAQARLGISGEEFLRRWDAGDYADPALDPLPSGVERLAALVPFGRSGVADGSQGDRRLRGVRSARIGGRHDRGPGEPAGSPDVGECPGAVGA